LLTAVTVPLSHAKCCIHSDINNVAENNKLTEDEVWSMVESVAEKDLPIDVENLTRLGIDEISLAFMSRKIYCRFSRLRYT